MGTTAQSDGNVWLSRRARLTNAAIGVTVGAICVPLVLVGWTPTWFALAWAAVYATVSGAFMVRVAQRPSPLVEQLWSMSAAAIYAAVLVSAVVWSDDTRHYWAALTIAVLFIAFEIAALPFIDIGDWRPTFVLMAGTIIVTGVFRVHPLVAFLFGPLSFSLGQGVGRVRGLKRQLETELASVRALAQHDELTGLMNRRGIRSELDRRVVEGMTVVMVDIDRFKQINDTHGYRVGDQVLTQVGAELARRLPGLFEIGRAGGDEFVAVATGHVAIPSGLVEPIACTATWHGHPIAIEVEVSGGVTNGRPGASVDRLLSEAGFALREAKRSTRSLSHFGGALKHRFDQTIEVASVNAGSANASGEFVPVAQAIVADDAVVGVEMLIRWKREDGSIVLPNDFLPLAVENGMMPTINDFMLEEAVRFASRFNHRPVAPFVSVNVTGSHLLANAFPERIMALLAEYRVDPTRLMIEITESEHIDRNSGWQRTAVELRHIGVKLAIDDFGTGYSSIDRLRHLPISHLKFDRSLVRAVSGPFGELLRGVTRFGEAAQIGVIAEGIETLDELEAMRSLGATMFQGHLFGRALDLDRLETEIIASLSGLGTPIRPD